MDEVVRQVQHRPGFCAGRSGHVLVERDRELVQRERHQSAIRRVAGHDAWGHDRRKHIHLCAVGDQQPAIAGGEQLLGTRAPARHLQNAKCGEVDHVQTDWHVVSGPLACRNKKQSFEWRTLLAEGERVQVGVDVDLRARLSVAIEADDLATLRPAAGPQLAVGGDREVVDAQITEMREAAGGGVEGLDAVARRHVEHTLRRVERQRLRQAVAVAVEDGEAGGVELEQLPATAGRPQAALAVVGQIEDRRVEHHLRVECLAAVLCIDIEAAAIEAATCDEAAVWSLEQRERAEAGVALRNARTEDRSRERREHLGELRRSVRRSGGHTCLCLGEQRIGRCGVARRRWCARVNGRPASARHIAQVGACAVVRQGLCGACQLAVTGVVGRQRSEFVALARLPLVNATGLVGLALPDFPCTAVDRDEDAGVPYTRAARLVGGAPLHIEGVARQRAGGEGSDRR